MCVQATHIELTPEERAELEVWARRGKTEQRLALRARIVLAADTGRGTREIARELDIRPATVSKWRIRFAQQRMLGITDAPRSGKPATYDLRTEQRILEAMDRSPPPGYAQWNGRLLAEELGDVSASQVWRVLRKHSISLQRRRSWCISTDPEFAAKAADIVGLYLNPPDKAVVLCVDEKPQIQALERAQGWLKLPNGKAVTGFSHGYKRHGTTTLIASLEVATGLVKVNHYRRRRRVEFLDFMNRIVDEYPEQEIHVILDNLNIHRPKQDQWLKRHLNVHFHFTPTYSSWLNQIECWFSILSRSALRGASFNSPQQVRLAIDRFVEAHNENAAPFEWTKTYVSPSAPKSRYADLRE